MLRYEQDISIKLTGELCSEQNNSPVDLKEISCISLLIIEMYWLVEDNEFVSQGQ